ncbi:MAG TPA: hypothetical protein VFN77_07230, partial [Acetobacteraceae bacterium]|nr:hypothetical protein [Acetobacteraceae bacterium]
FAISQYSPTVRAAQPELFYVASYHGNVGRMEVDGPAKPLPFLDKVIDQSIRFFNGRRSRPERSIWPLPSTGLEPPSSGAVAAAYEIYANSMGESFTTGGHPANSVVKAGNAREQADRPPVLPDSRAIVLLGLGLLGLGLATRAKLIELVYDEAAEDLGAFRGARRRETAIPSSKMDSVVHKSSGFMLKSYGQSFSLGIRK